MQWKVGYGCTGTSGAGTSWLMLSPPIAGYFFSTARPLGWQHRGFSSNR